jgi:hypothetical protein
MPSVRNKEATGHMIDHLEQNTAASREAKCVKPVARRNEIDPLKTASGKSRIT